MAIRIVLADDHQIVREGLRTLIAQQADMTVVAEAENGYRALACVKEHRPDVVVMDIGMPDLNGIEATRRILAEVPEVKVIALSIHSDRQFVANMLRAGASGYVLKEGAFRELAKGIRTVVAGQYYLSPDIAGILIEDFVRQNPEPTAGDASLLTPREREVLQLLAEGKTTRETAERLHVSVKTVESTRQNLREKLGVHSIAELTQYAIRAGIISL